MQARAAGRDKSAGGMRAFVAQEMRRSDVMPSSSPARALIREALQREIDILGLE